MSYLRDSNVLIDYLAGRFSSQLMARMGVVVNDELSISVVSKIEVLGFSSGNNEVDLRTEGFINLAKVFELTPHIVNKTIEIRKRKKIKVPDAIIASTAIVNNMTLLSSNLKISV